MSIHIDAFADVVLLTTALAIVLLLYLWGSSIAYLVIIGDSFSSLLQLVVGRRNFPHCPYTSQI